MITTERDAIAVQTRRVERGGNGYAKAVRRFMKRTNNFALRKRLPTLPRWARPE